MNDPTESILAEIREERRRQRELFSPEADAAHHPCVWVAIIARHIGLATMDGGLTCRKIFRRQLIRVGAVCLAALEALVRQMPAEEEPDWYTVAAQAMADEYGEAVLVLPEGRTYVDTGGSSSRAGLTCIVFAATASAQEREQAVGRYEPARKESAV